jgi:hypothetical protein
VTPVHLASSVDLPPWQFAANVAIRSALRFVQSPDRSGMVLRVNPLIEAVVLHPGVFAGLLKSDCAVRTADRAAESLGPVVHVAQLANKQPRVASANVTRDPERTEGLAECTKAVGDATEGTNHGGKARGDWRSVANQLFACSACNCLSGTFEPGASLAPMQYNEILARRIVAEVGRSSVDGGALQSVMLHEVARRLKIDEASAESAMHRAVAERWLVVEGSSLYRMRLTEAGRALSATR